MDVTDDERTYLGRAGHHTATVTELKQRLKGTGVSFSYCIDKSELVQRLREHERQGHRCFQWVSSDGRIYRSAFGSAGRTASREELRGSSPGAWRPELAGQGAQSGGVETRGAARVHLARCARLLRAA